MRISPAGPADVETIVELRRERATWLARRGIGQWSGAGLTGDGLRQRVAASVAAGETWIAATARSDEPGLRGPSGDASTEAVLGTIALDHHPDPGLWSDDELADALIVHRMIVRVAAAGQGVGAALLEHADHIARTQGCTWLRLDAWTSNTELHEAWRAHGFHHVRTDPALAAVTPSAALFERKVMPA